MYKSMIENWEKKTALEQLPERVNNTEYYQTIQTAQRVIKLIREYHLLGIDQFCGDYDSKPFDSHVHDSLGGSA